MQRARARARATSARRRLTSAGLVLVLACSSGTRDPVGQSAEAITSCGQTTLTVNTAGGYAPSTVNYANTTELVIPNALPHGSPAGYYFGSGGTESDTLVFNTNGNGNVTCTYSVSIPPSGPVPSPVPFSSCSPSTYTAGSSVIVMGGGSVTLNAPRPTSQDAPWSTSAVLAIGVDDGNPCTQDTCSNGNVSHTNLGSGTPVDDGNICNGVETCDGDGGLRDGSALVVNDTDPCVTTSCDPQQGIVTTPIANCTSPVSNVQPYAGGGTVPSDIGNGMAFLYAPDGGPQIGLTATMDTQRTSVIRGRVFARDGSTALPGATVTILGHPEYGATTTRADGWFDMAVNGGDTFTVQIALSGYLTAQRKATTRGLDWTTVQDTALVAKDAATTTITSNSGAWQVARGSTVTTAMDPDGTRTATVLFPPNTTITNPGFNPASFTVRATELTVGANGPTAMSGELPPQSAYTYAVELGVDEADAQGISSVTFNQPIYFYVENFVGTPSDTNNVINNVPTGS